MKYLVLLLFLTGCSVTERLERYKRNMIACRSTCHPNPVTGVRNDGACICDITKEVR